MSSRLLTRSEFFPGAGHSVAVEARYPQCEFPLHRHDFDEIIIICSGNGLHIWNDMLYRVTYGDVFYITQQDNHSFQSVEHLELYNILFCRDRLRLGTDWQSLLPEPDSAQQQRHWRLSAAGVTAIKAQIHSLERESKNSDPLSIRLCETRFLELALLLVRFRHMPGQPLSDGVFGIDTVINHVYCHLNEKLELDALCSRQQVSSRTIRDLFKQATGMTISRYQLYCRLYHGMNLIKTSSQAISEIALQCGFNDSNYFSVLFQRMFNQSPSYFRRASINGAPPQERYLFTEPMISSGKRL